MSDEERKVEIKPKIVEKIKFVKPKVVVEEIKLPKMAEKIESVSHPVRYDGSKCFVKWLTSFNICAKANRWKPGDKLLHLPTYFDSTALDFYNALSEITLTDWDILVSTYSDRFSVKGKPESHLSEFNHVNMLPGETLQQFSVRLETVARSAYEKKDRASYDLELRTKFLECLSLDLSTQILDRDFETYDEMVTFALRRQKMPKPLSASLLSQNINAMTLGHTQFPVQTSSSVESKPFKVNKYVDYSFACHKCQGYGHYANSCPSGYDQGSNISTRLGNSYMQRQNRYERPTESARAGRTTVLRHTLQIIGVGISFRIIDHNSRLGQIQTIGEVILKLDQTSGEEILKLDLTSGEVILTLDIKVEVNFSKGQVDLMDL